ncbi:hypothetical protein F0L17_25225 [Streptomyces sp. TRM43335]|uniref:Uncharacterized protein n=1 Tax=Streptomyces taklimakanensis TaxID=2569853 RepID=A0A6G2BJV7_9ACTN|nr:hypothetical protein [Streptomyces taklimakanensis]MTE22343.1 hypothetical protein [Streptomyces taklimakanensis]
MPDQDATPPAPRGRPDRPGDEERDRTRNTERTPVEEDPAVRRAITDDNTATVLATEDEEDRGPLAPSFREPDGSDDRKPGGSSPRDRSTGSD